MLGLLSHEIDISNELYDNALELEDFAVEIRYPDTSVNLSDDNIRQAFKIVKFIRAFVLLQMNLTNDYSDVRKE